MGNKHTPGLITVDQLSRAKQELMAMIESIDTAISSMKRQKVDSMWMFYRQSLDGGNGGLVRLSTFINGLDHAKRRLISGNPVYDGESKTRGVSHDQAEQDARKIAENETVYQAFQEVMAQIRPEVEKRVSEKLRHTAPAPIQSKGVTAPRKKSR